MKTRISFTSVVRVLLAFCVLNFKLIAVFAQGTAFTYQGQLQSGGSTAHGNYNLQFSLYTNATTGTAVAGPITTNGVFITNGLFTVTIDFGASVWSGATNWLQIAVETNGASSFTSLTPRQQLMPAPYAIFAEGANAAGLIGPVPSTALTSLIGSNGVTVLPSSGSVTVGLSNTLTLPSVPVTITAGGNLILYADENNLNYFAGSAGNVATSGGQNTAEGILAFNQNINGSDNTADGFAALYANTNGTDNTALGVGALFGNLSGFFNTAVGVDALTDNSSGSNNTAVGYNALIFNYAGSNNTAVGVSALAGNANGSGYNNTAVGYLALQQNSGILNTANGALALENNFGGAENTANGFRALADNSAGNDNTAVGALALAENSIGSLNTATGVGALTVNTAGQNTADGADALDVNNSGSNNLASGYAALSQNVGGNYNVGVGSDALLNNVGGSGNTAVGYQALVGVGYDSSFGGTADIAIGYLAGSAFTENESSNIDIGNIGVANEHGIIRIGTQGQQTATYLVGNVYTPSGTVQSSSDRNAKEDFAPVSPQLVLAKITAIPVTEWNYKTDKGVEHIGPMAQDFHAAFGLNGPDDKHISVVDEGGVALAAIQGLNQKLEKQQAENTQLREELNELKAEVKSLEQMRGNSQ